MRRVKRGPFSNCVDINTKLVNRLDINAIMSSSIYTSVKYEKLTITQWNANNEE